MKNSRGIDSSKWSKAFWVGWCISAFIGLAILAVGVWGFVELVKWVVSK